MTLTTFDTNTASGSSSCFHLRSLFSRKSIIIGDGVFISFALVAMVEVGGFCYTTYLEPKASP